MMFAWANPDYQLDKMSLDQIVYYYNKGWEAEEIKAKIHWGTYGKLLNKNSEPETPIQNIQNREELEPLFKGPEYEFRDGAVWKGNKKIIYYKE